jgi:hypothetical protein
MRRSLLLPALAAALLLHGCPRADPTPTFPDGGRPDGGEACARAAQAEDVSGCQSLATDYLPRVHSSATDSWPACISDDGQYHWIGASISTIARVEAFEQVGTLLWGGTEVPSAQDFLDAKVLYAQDQGLDSRVQRREDVHYPPPSDGARCSDPGIPDQYPDRCVGPAKLLPILNDAFSRGAKGEAPQVHAARVEAALLWFLYVSVLSEVTSCATRNVDCDSAWAYYSGGTPRESPAGLARAIHRLGPETHQRAYDGVLAVRCWRNLDNETGAATDLALRDRARAQLDRAMLRGMALLLADRLQYLDCPAEPARAAALAFAQVLGPLLDRAARERNGEQADALAQALGAATPQGVDVPTALAALAALFPCP